MRSWLQWSALVLAVGAPHGPAPELAVVTDEAEAALVILDLRAAGKPVPPVAWDRVFRSEGYRRLRARERALGREFEDSAFRAFLTSDSLLRRAPALHRTLRDWREARFDDAARRALAYLPAGTRLRARVYLLIKPRTNSFVFEPDTDPAIMLYLDPARTRAQLENTVAHELHHIGYAGACSSSDAPADSAVSAARQWASAFGEGVAMLAAAGGPEVHPHAVSPPEDRARWDRDVAGASADLRRVETFLFDVLDRRIAADSADRAGMAFFGVQGPWYTLGWVMAATLERESGRAALVGSLCDPAALLAAYNDAAGRALQSPQPPRWSATLIARLTSARAP